MNLSYSAAAWKVLLPAVLFAGVSNSQKFGGNLRRLVGAVEDSAASSAADRKPTERRELTSTNLVDHLFTYGAPSIANPHMSNPGNTCIPGIRTYTEDVYSGDTGCGWWNWLWCDPNERITDTDFAAQWNGDDYPHPKMSTLVLRYRDDSDVEYFFMECQDGAGQHDFQSWPGTNQPAGVLDNIHSLEEHYERRLLDVPASIRGPLLDYTSVSKCGYETSANAITRCLNRYDRKMNGLPGVAPAGWEVAAFMNHQTQTMTGTDEDIVYVLKNDDLEPGRRSCIISFMGSDNAGGDLWNFVFGNSGSTGYCGRYGVHIGVRNELWQITHNTQWSTEIRPALEECHEVTCVGHSLGGSLCNVFTMCANQGEENLGTNGGDAGMYDDYNSLIWTKKV